MGRTRATELSEFLDDIEHLTDEYDFDTTLVRSCKCGYTGPLIHDVDGHVCEACGYLLIPK